MRRWRDCFRASCAFGRCFFGRMDNLVYSTLSWRIRAHPARSLNKRVLQGPMFRASNFDGIRVSLKTRSRFVSKSPLIFSNEVCRTGRQFPRSSRKVCGCYHPISNAESNSRRLLGTDASADSGRSPAPLRHDGKVHNPLGGGSYIFRNEYISSHIRDRKSVV